jgi:hypothetical protein
MNVVSGEAMVRKVEATRCCSFREDHWLSRSETRLQMLTTSVAFLRANNPPE